MNIISFNTPLFWVVTLLLLYTFLRFGYQRLILAFHSAATFGVQFSFIVNWSAGKVLPILALPYALRKGKTGLGVFSVFCAYVIVNTLIQSFFWDIPAGVHFAYGQGRFLVQLFNFSMTAMLARATVLALTDSSQVQAFWKIFTYAMLAHGLASLYQLAAGRLGLPLLGISRPFEQVMADRVADVAMFGTESRQTVYRPGGLAGEPKGVAVLYAIYMTGYLFGGSALALGRRNLLVSRAVFMLSLLGFIAAFSTSAFIGIVPVAFFCLSIWGVKKFSKTAFYLLLFLAIAIPLWAIVSSLSLDDFSRIIELRTVGRFEGGEEVDPSVVASIDEILAHPLVMLLGTGAGGSSFVIMKYLNQAFDYAYAPNVGIVLIIVEYGLIGMLLLFVPYAMVLLKAAERSKRSKDPNIMLLCAISISTFMLCLTGSGYEFGFPLAIASAAAALRLPVKNPHEKQ